MPLDRLDDYIADVQANAAANPGVTVRLGIEADYFSQTWRQLDGLLKAHPFDYVIGSVHYVGTFPVDFSPVVWEPLGQADIDEIYRGYWIAIRELAECGIYDIVGHLDLPKKFGFVPACDLSHEIGAALDAIATAGVAVELNTSGWDKTCADGYPAQELVQAVHDRDIPVLVSADAHAPTEVARHYDKAVKRLTDAGYTEFVTFEQRRRTVRPLAPLSS
jgi:histidinol-phosphatase (PHP family)